MNRLSLKLPPLPAASPMVTNGQPVNHATEARSYYQESDIFHDITLRIVLPNGLLLQMLVKSGETVQEIKRKLHTVHGVPFEVCSLYHYDKLMLDPLSLNDFPCLVSESSATISVKINGPSGCITEINEGSGGGNAQLVLQQSSSTLDSRVSYSNENHLHTPISNNQDLSGLVQSDIGNSNNNIGFGQHPDNSLSSTQTIIHPHIINHSNSNSASTNSNTDHSPNEGKYESENPRGSTTIDVTDDTPIPQLPTLDCLKMSGTISSS